jgi:hypothetical protein
MPRISPLKLAGFSALALAALAGAWQGINSLKTRWDCENLVRQDVYRRVALSGLYWPGESRVKFWDLRSATSLLFDSGLSFLEVNRKHYLGHELAGKDVSGRYRSATHLKIYFAQAGAPHCEPFEYLTTRYQPFQLTDLVSRGLRPGECVAIEPVSAPSAEYEVAASVTARGDLDYIRHRLLERRGGGVVAEYLTITQRNPSDKSGGYACGRNSQAYKGFPWTAIDVVATPAARSQPQAQRMPGTPGFAKIRSEVAPQLRVTTDPSARAYSHAEYHRNAILDAGAAAIVSHNVLQLASEDRRWLVPLSPIEGQAATYSLLRKSADRLFVVGVVPEKSRIAVLQMSASGEPLQADFLTLPAAARKKPDEGYYFDLEVGRSGYQLTVHAGRPPPSQGSSKMRQSTTLKIALD